MKMEKVGAHGSILSVVRVGMCVSVFLMRKMMNVSL